MIWDWRINWWVNLRDKWTPLELRATVLGKAENKSTRGSSSIDSSAGRTATRPPYSPRPNRQLLIPWPAVRVRDQPSDIESAQSRNRRPATACSGQPAPQSAHRCIPDSVHDGTDKAVHEVREAFSARIGQCQRTTPDIPVSIPRLRTHGICPRILRVWTQEPPLLLTVVPRMEVVQAALCVPHLTRELRIEPVRTCSTRSTVARLLGLPCIELVLRWLRSVSSYPWVRLRRMPTDSRPQAASQPHTGVTAQRCSPACR